MTEPVHAHLTGSDTCTALGLTVRATAPALALCRKLVEAGYDPVRPLHAYRGDVLCLTVSSIGWGAKHTVREDGMKLVRLPDSLQRGKAGPHVRLNTAAGIYGDSLLRSRKRSRAAGGMASRFSQFGSETNQAGFAWQFRCLRQPR